MVPKTVFTSRVSSNFKLIQKMFTKLLLVPKKAVTNFGNAFWVNQCPSNIPNHYERSIQTFSEEISHQSFSIIFWCSARPWNINILVPSRFSNALFDKQPICSSPKIQLIQVISSMSVGCSLIYPKSILCWSGQHQKLLLNYGGSLDDPGYYQKLCENLCQHCLSFMISINLFHFIHLQLVFDPLRYLDLKIGGGLLQRNGRLLLSSTSQLKHHILH